MYDSSYYLTAVIALYVFILFVVKELSWRASLREKNARKHRDARDKQKQAQLAHLGSEVVRTRLMVDAWLSRFPNATLRHPGAKIVLIAHMDALRAYHELAGSVQYVYPRETVKQYDNAYWRAVWHVLRCSGTVIAPRSPSTH